MDLELWLLLCCDERLETFVRVLIKKHRTPKQEPSSHIGLHFDLFMGNVYFGVVRLFPSSFSLSLFALSFFSLSPFALSSLSPTFLSSLSLSPLSDGQSP